MWSGQVSLGSSQVGDLLADLDGNSGSNYVYSAYAPQLASELAISSTQINLIGTAGNLGMYLSGPVCVALVFPGVIRMSKAEFANRVGRYVDAHGPRIPLLVGGTLNFVGYNMVRMFFQHTIAVRVTPAGPVSSLRLGLLAFAMFMTGVGGSAGLSASVNAVAKSFPDRTRASATGTVLAGFGLSAFLFSTVGHALFEGDAGGLLLLLALGTGLPSIIGSFVVRAVPPAAAQSSAAAGYQPVSIGPDIVVVDHSRVSIDQTPYSRSSSLEMSRSCSPASRQRHHPLAHEIQSSHRDDDREDAAGGSEISFTKPFDGSADDDERMGGIAHALPPHLTPHELLRSKDFYTLFTVLALCCGTGLMYINNAGTVALALGRMGKLVYDTKRVASYQAKQVAIVSIWNCTGRIVGGLVSDMAKMKLGIKRVRLERAAAVHRGAVADTVRYGSCPSWPHCSSSPSSRRCMSRRSSTFGWSRRCSVSPMAACSMSFPCSCSSGSGCASLR